MKTIDDFIKELQRISPDKRQLPLVIVCPNGNITSPCVKMLMRDIRTEMKEGEHFDDIVSMVITWRD